MRQVEQGREKGQVTAAQCGIHVTARANGLPIRFCERCLFRVIRARFDLRLTYLITDLNHYTETLHFFYLRLPAVLAPE